MRYILTTIFVILLAATPSWALSGQQACSNIVGEMLEGGMTTTCKYVQVQDTGQHMYSLVLVSYPDGAAAAVLPLLAIVVLNNDARVPTKTMGVGVFVGSSKAIMEMSTIRGCRRTSSGSVRLFQDCINTRVQFL